MEEKSSLSLRTFSNKRKTPNFWLILMVIFFVVGVFFGGVIYWFWQKSIKITDSAFLASQNIKIETTPTPSESENTSSFSSLVMPEEDAEGQDLEEVPRYPGAIRESYYQAEDADYYVIDFVAKDFSSKIIDYYKTTLEEKGWTLTSANNNVWNFQKETYSLTIEIIQEEVLTPITQYRIQYVPAKEGESGA